MNPGLPILDATYNKKENSKGVPTPTPGKSSSAGLPVLDVNFNSQFKKKVGGEEYGTNAAPIESQSASVSVSTEPTNPSSFLSKDIDESESFTESVFDFANAANQNPITPAAPAFQQQQEKEKRKQQILTEPEQLKEYSRRRVTSIQDDITRLNNELQKYKQPNLYLAGSPGAPISLDVTYAEGSEPIMAEITAKKKYLEEYKNNVQNVAAYAVVAKEDLSEVSDAKMKAIGAKYLETINDATVGDDITALRGMDASGYAKDDAERSSQNINYRLYKSGANAIARYYSDVAEDTYRQNEGKVAELNDLIAKRDAEKNPTNKAAYQSAINILSEDEGVKKYIESSDRANEYIGKSKNAISQFPQVERRAMRQQLSDAFFRMSSARNNADAGSPMTLLNWIFGDQARESDIPELSKQSGIPVDEIRDIINIDIKGWFGGADNAGVRIPGMLTGIAQSADQTIGSIVMGAKRFIGTENVEAENRILSDRMEDYNLRANKAKLFDDAGKLNFNPYSVMNTIGTGIGQTAIYAAPSMATGGLAGVAAEGIGMTTQNANRIGKLMSVATTTGTGFVGSYEDAYKFAATQTADETLRRAYALKVGLVNGLSESILEPADIARKLAIGPKMTKGNFDNFQKTFTTKGQGAAIASGFKEFGKVVGTENLEELVALVGETKAKEVDLGIETTPGDFINNAIETTVTTTLTTLPLGIGAGINSTRDQSNIRKQGLFEAGNEPDLYKSKLKGLLDDGSINQTQFNERSSVINTMAKIVPAIKPTDINGNPLSYQQKANLAAEQFRILNNNKMLENPDLIEAEKPIIEADTKEALENQKNILTGVPVETTTDATPSQPDESTPLSMKDNLIEKIGAIESENPMVQMMAQNPNDAISFIQEQATGMTTARDIAEEPAYEGAVAMFGEDIVNQAVSILPQEQKDMIIRSWNEKAIEVSPSLMKSIQSTNTTKNESKDSESGNQETGQTSEESDSNADQEGKITVGELMDRPVAYKGRRATISQDGQTIIATTEEDGTEYELGNVDEISGADISEFDIEQEQQIASVADDGKITVRGAEYVNPSENPMDSFVRNEEGDVIAVKLQTPEGNRRTFRGQVAQDLAYQISLREITKDNESREQFEQFVENDEESRSEILSGSNEEVTAEESAKDNEQVQETPEKSKQRKKAERKSTAVREESKQEPVEKEKTKVKPKKITTIEQAEEELKRIFAMDRIEGGQSGNLPIEEYTKRATAILSQLYPDATIDIYDNAQEYYDKTGRPVGSLGVFNPVSKNLSLNLELIKSSGASNTVLHEVIHPIVNEVLLSDSETFQEKINDAWDRIEELKSIPGMKSVFEHAGKYSTLTANQQKIEGITEFLTQVADGNIDLSKAPKAIATRIIDLINDLLSLIGSSARISSESDLDNLANAIKKSFETSDANPIIKKIGERKETIATGAMDALSSEEQERAVRDIISRSKDIDQNQLKQAIKKYTNWSDEKIDGLFTKTTGIAHAQTSETAKEFGFQEYQTSPETFDEWDKEALEKIKSGYDVGALVNRMSNGHMPTAVEQRMVRMYLQNLEATVEEDPSDVNLTKLMAAIRASDIAGGRLVGQSLVARKGTGVRDNSLAGFFVREQEEVNEGAPLTEAQKDNVKKEYAAMQDAQLKLEQKMIALEKENARLRAEKAVKSEKSKTKPQKKTHTEYAEERKNIISSIKEKLKAARTGESGLTAVPVPYARELFAIAPDVMKLTRSLIEEGVSNLADIVSDIHGQLKDSIEGLTEKDIHDIIAGDYNEKKPTRSDITKQLADLRQQAKLQNQLESLLKGESKQKKERQKTQWSKEVEDLKAKIKEIEQGDDIPTSQQKLNAIKTRTENAIKQLQGELKTGNYQEDKLDDRSIKLDKEAVDLKDKLIELRRQRDVRIMQHKYKNRTAKQKAIDRVIEVANVPRTLMASVDYSAPLRQAIIPTISHPTMAAKAGLEMFKMSISQKRFDRWFYDLKQSPNYNIIQDSGLYVADPHDPRLSSKEEAFMNNLAEKIPILGGEVSLKGDVKIPFTEKKIGNFGEGIKIPGTNRTIKGIGGLVKGSERAYVGYLNKMRVDLFNRMTDAYAQDGFTFENSPDLYKATAMLVNNMTGRGGIGKLESAAPVLNAAFFSPRLMASRLNILGLADLNFFGKGFYRQMPRKVRVQAYKDLAITFGAISSLMGLLAIGFMDDDRFSIELDPRSTDFGKVRYGNTRWDLWGGFQQYIRVIAQLVSGQKKSSTSGNVSNLDGEGVFGESRGSVVGRFVRGKLAPVPSTLVDLASGRNIIGEEVTLGSEALEMVQPLIYQDLKEAIKDKGAGAIFTVGLPSAFGIGVQTQNPRGYENINKDKGVYKTLYDNNLNLTLPPQGTMTEKQYEEFVPKQQKLVADQWDEVIKYGAQLNENGGVTIDENKAVAIKPFNDLTHEEKTTLMRSISTRSTRVAKEELGIKEEKEIKNKEYLNQ